MINRSVHEHYYDSNDCDEQTVIKGFFFFIYPFLPVPTKTLRILNYLSFELILSKNVQFNFVRALKGMFHEFQRGHRPEVGLQLATFCQAPTLSHKTHVYVYSFYLRLRRKPEPFSRQKAFKTC